MVAAMKYSVSDGISKKICMQASGLSQDNSVCDLFCLGDAGIIKLSYQNSEFISKEYINNYTYQEEGMGGINQERDLLEGSMEAVKKGSYSLAYVRHMLPCQELLAFLKLLRNKNIKIGYEIPTYPYYFEQLNISHNKLKTTIKLMIESVYWPLIYKQIDKLFVVSCNSKARKFKKMVLIRNGFSGKFNSIANCNTENLEMIGVGTIYPYHGYDKIIKSMERCNATLKNGKSIFFHIVGGSAETEVLREYVKNHNLEKNVLFYGKQYGEQLLNIYRKANLGVGTMALSLRHADIDTAIKNIEYFAYGLPVITSGSIFDISDNKGIYMRVLEKTEIDLEKIYTFTMNSYTNRSKKGVIQDVLKHFDWNYEMREIIRSLMF